MFCVFAFCLYILFVCCFVLLHTSSLRLFAFLPALFAFSSSFSFLLFIANFIFEGRFFSHFSKRARFSKIVGLEDTSLGPSQTLKWFSCRVEPRWREETWRNTRGRSMAMGVALYRWLVYFREDPIIPKWMMTGGSPIFKGSSILSTPGETSGQARTLLWMTTWKAPLSRVYSIRFKEPLDFPWGYQWIDENTPKELRVSDNAPVFQLIKLLISALSLHFSFWRCGVFMGFWDPKQSSRHVAHWSYSSSKKFQKLKSTGDFYKLRVLCDPSKS